MRMASLYHSDVVRTVGEQPIASAFQVQLRTSYVIGRCVRRGERPRMTRQNQTRHNVKIQKQKGRAIRISRRRSAPNCKDGREKRNGLAAWQAGNSIRKEKTATVTPTNNTTNY